MSENLDLACSIFANWERGDFSRTDWAHPEIEYMVVDEPGSTSLKGLAAMGNAWRQFLSAWEEYGAEAEEYLELDDGRVLVLLHAFGRGRTSGLELGDTTRGKGANVFQVQDRKVIRLRTYFDRRGALADLGLAEYAMSQEDVDLILAFMRSSTRPVSRRCDSPIRQSSGTPAPTLLTAACSKPWGWRSRKCIT
jgi:ketosteroid isomerase-like protein